MGKQVHFVVVADLDSESWWIDDEVFTARFGSNEGTWNEDTEEWETTTDDDHWKALQILNQGRES